MDQALGYDDEPIGRSVLRARAEHLMQNGFATNDLQERCLLHYGKLDSVRRGDTLIRTCGSQWNMRGGGGSRCISTTAKVKIVTVTNGGRVDARCPISGNFGEIHLIDFLFEIENA